MKKVRNLILFFALSFLTFLIVSFLPKSYEYKYILKKVEITERYNKNTKVYSFILKADDVIYEYSLENRYIKKRGLIDSISIKNNCLTAKASKTFSFNICKKEDGYHTSFYSKKDNDKVLDKYGRINIYNLNNHKYYIWNYTDFIAIDSENYEKISLFDNDVYELALITKLNDYLVIADYDQKYKFDKMYLINSKNNKVEEANLDKEIYFESYILGTYKKDIYLYDLQKELEYKINPFKETVNKSAYEIRVDKKWEKISVNKLNKKNTFFEDNNNFEYFIKDDYLYYKADNISIKVSDKIVTNIIESNKKTAYFISEDALYYVDIEKGIIKIMSNSEWNFNSKNIYIF